MVVAPAMAALPWPRLLRFFFVFTAKGSGYRSLYEMFSNELTGKTSFIDWESVLNSEYNSLIKNSIDEVKSPIFAKIKADPQLNEMDDDALLDMIKKETLHHMSEYTNEFKSELPHLVSYR